MHRRTQWDRPRARWFEKRTRSRSDISHLVAAITQPEKRRSPMKKGIGIVVAIAAICGLTWGFLELREEGYFSPYAPSKPNVVAQTSTDKTDYRFPLLIADDGSFQDLDLRVKFKAVSGEVDRAGGLVFRLKDANNYYIVRANALEDNYRLYHVIEGKRRQFAGANFKVTSGEWHELRVECVGNKIICYYDGAKKIEATDDTFKDGGKIGLWTKADSVTYFDDLKVTAR